MPKKRTRSRLAQPQARRRYVEMGELAVLEQIRKDSQALDGKAIAVGPFARLEAAAVATRDGKTRGAVTNLFGSQAAFQVETMTLALSARDWIDRLEFPQAEGFTTPEAWLDALFAGESERGPKHGAEPEVTYGFLWALWLSAVPYGLWSESVTKPSLAEFGQWVAKLEAAFAAALDRFGMRLREGVTVADLACSAATLIEGAWLTQCLTVRHPVEARGGAAGMLKSAGRLLWQGATEPGAAAER